METTGLTTNSRSGYKRREPGNKDKEETILVNVLLGIKHLKIGKIITDLFVKMFNILQKVTNLRTLANCHCDSYPKKDSRKP